MPSRKKGCYASSNPPLSLRETIEDKCTDLLLLLELSGASLTSLLLTLALLEKGLWDQNLVVGWDRSVKWISEVRIQSCMEEGAE